jgi:transketolase
VRLDDGQLFDRSVTPAAIRRIVLEQSRRANVGHIGSALSIAELVSVVQGRVLRESAPDDPDRDRFILSKGHAALALYAALHLRGLISAEELDTFCGDGSRLGVHPEHVAPGVDFSTGSLGHGLTIGTGSALAARLSGSDRRVFVLLSDAECNEGSTWEAAMFAAHHRLGHLVAIVDRNGQQAIGYTKDVLDIDPAEGPWAAFGWEVRVVDGHDEDALEEAMSGLDASSRPRVVIAETTFGKGVSFMERRIEWHYLPLDDEQLQRALDEVGQSAEQRARP